MIARVVGRTRLTGLRRSGLVFHVLSSASNEDAEQYYQIARLRDVFSLDNATGSDLDERAAEIDFDGTLGRVGKTFATGAVVFGRPGTTGTTSIPIGSIVGAKDSQGVIQYQTTGAGSITPGNTLSAQVPVIALVAGTRGNVAAGAISRLVSRPPGVTTVTNPSKFDNALDKEEDPLYLARIRTHQQSMSRATPLACEDIASKTSLSNGARVRHSKIVEPVVPTGRAVVYIDDGTGSLDVFNADYLTTPETVIASAAGGETRTRVSKFAVRDDGSFVLRKNGVAMVRDVDYFLNRASGEISFATALTATDQITALYRYYTGLVYEAQKRVTGDPADRVTYPGVGGAATEIRVLPAIRSLQSVTGLLSVAANFDVVTVTAAVSSAIQEYINTLGIGAPVLVFELYGAVKKVSGVANFQISDLSGSSPALDQITAEGAVPRILSTAISIL